MLRAVPLELGVGRVTGANRWFNNLNEVMLHAPGQITRVKRIVCYTHALLRFQNSGEILPDRSYPRLRRSLCQLPSPFSDTSQLRIVSPEPATMAMAPTYHVLVNNSLRDVRDTLKFEKHNACTRCRQSRYRYVTL